MLVIVPLAFELLFVGVLTKLLLEARSQLWEERRARNIVTTVSILSRQTQTSARVLALYVDSRDPNLLKQFENIRKVIPSEFDELRTLLKDKPEDLQDLKKLQESVDMAIAIFESCKSTFGNNDNKDYNKIVFYPRLYHQGVLAERQFDKLLKRYRIKEMADRAANDNTSNVITIVLTAFVVANVILALSLARNFNRSITSRLNILVDNTIRVAANKPLNERMQGNDEIAELDAVFHNMVNALSEANKVKQEFVAMISHDLRSPLTAVQCTLELIKDGAYGKLNETGSKRVQTAEREADRLIALINNLLDIEKLEAGQMVLDLVAMPLKPIVESAIDSIKPLCEAKHVTINSDLQEVTVLADDNRLMQVLINLLSNAIKFTNKDSSVEVSIKKLPRIAEISIADHGRGIPASMRKDIFDRWKQTAKEDGHAGKGSGLGLAISKSIIEAHNGSIGFDSKEGEGTTFWIRIPMLESETAEAN